MDPAVPGAAGDDLGGVDAARDPDDEGTLVGDRVCRSAVVLGADGS